MGVFVRLCRFQTPYRGPLTYNNRVAGLWSPHHWTNKTSGAGWCPGIDLYIYIYVICLISQLAPPYPSRLAHSKGGASGK